MKAKITTLSATFLILTGCGRSGASEVPEKATQARIPVAAAPYDTRLPMPEFMGHVMQHGGDGIWKWQGLVIDKDGEHSLYPKNIEDWEDAESGALTLAELTNLLLIPGRRIADPGWDASVAAVRKVALDAADAAEKQDKTAFLKAGSALDEACDSCHVRYDPNFKADPG